MTTTLIQGSTYRLRTAITENSVNHELARYVEQAGPTYGTESRSWFLYAIVKMQRPDLVLELGTGLGPTSFLMAQALRENGNGHLVTVDDGSHWNETRHNPVLREFGANETIGYGEFMNALARRFDLASQFDLIQRTLPPYPRPEKPIDLLFSDFRHDVPGIIDLLANYLPRMAPASSIFIDSASTFHPSYTFLEHLVSLLNQGKLPASLAGKDQVQAMWNLIQQRRFTLVHLTEPARKEQNSMAWLKIEPIDIVAHPRAATKSA